MCCLKIKIIVLSLSIILKSLEQCETRELPNSLSSLENKIGVTTVSMILFEGEMYGGKKQELQENSTDLPDLTNGFPIGVRSIIVKENAKIWQVFSKVGYYGASVTLEPGRSYKSLDAMGLENPVMSMRGFSFEKSAAVYQDEGYGGKRRELEENSPDLSDLRNIFPEGARSIILKENAKKWQVFTQVGYYGASVTLEPGRRYRSLDAMGLENPVNSMRRFSFEKSAAVYQNEGYGGKRHELEKNSPDLPDLRNIFPEGAHSIILKVNAKKWQVFTQVGYYGANVTLEPGRRYTSLDAMGLESPVMSMKTSSGDNADVNTEN